MKNKVYIFIIAMFVSRAFSVGEAGAIFLLINPGSRAAGSGEAQVAKADDAYASYYNPAGLGFLRGQEVVMQHVNWLPNLTSDIFYEFLAYRKSVPNLGTFGGHIIFLNLGTQQGMDEWNNYTGEFKSYMAAINFSYGTQISKKQSVGMNFKIFHQKLADRPQGAEVGDPFSTDFAFDIGYLQKFGRRNQHQFGFAIQNIGPPIDFIDAAQADPAPTNMRMGIYTELFNDGVNKINLLLDANKLLVASYPTMDWDGDGIISGSKEKSHSDPWYKGVFTAWLDDWYYGGDYDLFDDNFDGFDGKGVDLDIEHTHASARDGRIGGYFALPSYSYVQNDALYAEFSKLHSKIGEDVYAPYYIDDVLFNDTDNTSVFSENPGSGELYGHLTSLDFLIENFPDKVNDLLSLKSDQIIHIPNYDGFCNEVYTPHKGRFYADGEKVNAIGDTYGYSMCYDLEGDSAIEYVNNGSFNEPDWTQSENTAFGTLAFLDLPHDGMGDFDKFDPACTDDIDGEEELSYCTGIAATYGDSRYDILVIEDEEDESSAQDYLNYFGEHNFDDSNYGEYNGQGTLEKGSGEEREFKNELEEMIYNFGMEWSYTEYFTMRFGFIYDLEGDVKNPTFGAGINFDRYGFDFGYTAGEKGHPRENTMFFSLSLGI